MGSINVRVKDDQDETQLLLLVVDGNGPSQLGCNWLSEIRLDWKRIFMIHTQQSLTNIMEKHKEVFKSELGTLTGVESSGSARATPLL